ncbi:MAG: YdcH family protein [Acidobacteriota bacterium]
MVQDHHPLVKDFPELKDKIHTLKTSNAHFAKLERDYEEVDKAIVRLENGVEHGSSAELEQKKLQRVSLKDELYSMLKA